MKPSVFGLDISDNSAELVALSRIKGKVSAVRVGRLEIPAGLIRRGVVQEPDRVVDLLNRFFDAALGPKRGKLAAGVSLPDTQVYSMVFVLPANLSLEMAAKAAAIEAANVFPLSLADIVSDAVVLSRAKDRQEVLYAASERQPAGDYVAILRRAGVEPLFLEAESLSIARALTDPLYGEPVLVADIGAKTTLLTIVDQGGTRLNTSVALGGNNLTAAIETQLNVPLEKAETFKRTAGFDPAAETGRVVLILQKPMAEIIGEMSRTIDFYRQKTGRKPAKIILAGGTSLVPFIAEYIASNLPNVTVVRGEPFKEINVDHLPKPEELKTNAILYATAAGLALRAGGYRSGPGINLLPEGQGRRSGSSSIGEMVKRIGLALSSMAKKKPVQPAEAGDVMEEKPVVRHQRAPAKPVPAEVEEAKIREPVEEAPPAAAPPPKPAPPPADPPKHAAPRHAAKPAAPPPKPVPVEPEPPEDEAAEETDDVPAEEPVSSQPEEDVSARGAGYLLDSSRFDLKKPEKPAPAKPVPASSIVPPVKPAAVRPAPAKPAPVKPAAVRPAPAKPPAEPPANSAVESARGSKVLWVDSIIAGRKAPEEAEAAKPADKTPAAGTARRPRLWIWVLLVLILIGAAAGGVYMFARKAGFASDTLLARMTKVFQAGEQQAATQPAEPAVNAAPQEAAPATVSLVVLVGKEKAPASDRPSVVSRVIETDVSSSDTFSATGQGSAPGKGGTSTGTIKITNKTATPYTFVATTRFLSKEGVLFRLKTQTAIPANGSVDAAVYADKSGATGDIGPTTFTVPGLGKGFEDKVYGESSAAMSGGAGSGVQVVSADDLNKAKISLTDRLKTEALANMRAMTTKDELVVAELVTSQELSSKAPPAGTPAANFSMSFSARFRALVIPQDQMDSLLTDKLKSSLPAGRNLADYSLGEITYKVEAYDTQEDLAEVRVEAPVLKI